MRAHTVVFLPVFLLLAPGAGPPVPLAAAPPAASYREILFPPPIWQPAACCGGYGGQGWSGMIAAGRGSAHVPLAAHLAVSLNTGLLQGAARPAPDGTGGVRLFAQGGGTGQGLYY
jgi:hypothetical protein